jgi:hypothetical protein
MKEKRELRKPYTQWEKGFIQGYTCAVANDIRNHGIRTEVEDLWKGNSHTAYDLKRAGVDPEDIKLLIEHKLTRHE